MSKLSGFPLLAAIMGPFEMRIKTPARTARCRQTSLELLLPRALRRLHHGSSPRQPMARITAAGPNSDKWQKGRAWDLFQTVSPVIGLQETT